MASAEPPEGEQTGGSPDEDLGFEIAFYEGILEQAPDAVNVLMALGDDYLRSGLTEKSLAVDQRLCQIRAGDPIIQYNVACHYALLGRADEAFAALEQAVAFGYHDLDHLHRDPDLDTLRDDPRYPALLERVLRKEFTA